MAFFLESLESVCPCLPHVGFELLGIVFSRDADTQRDRAVRKSLIKFMSLSLRLSLWFRDCSSEGRGVASIVSLYDVYTSSALLELDNSLISYCKYRRPLQQTCLVCQRYQESWHRRPRPT